MLHIDIIAAGRMRDNAQIGLWQNYIKRLQWPLTLHEIDSKKIDKEEEKLLSKIDPHAFIFVLDERGKNLSSIDFAKKLESMTIEGTSRVQFILGSADGLSHLVKNKANFLLSFGLQTWPHMLARIMLIEQIYRAQQILAGHPYHKE